MENTNIFKKGDKKNQSIIFIHGFAYDYSIWDAQIAFFSKDFYCIAYDVRGLGSLSDFDDQFSMEEYVDDLEELIASQNIKKPILCAMSMGGYIALRAIERFGDKIGGLILCDSVAFADSDEAKLKRAAAIKSIKKSGLKSFLEDFIPRCYGSSYIKSSFEEIKKRIKKSADFNPKGVIGALFAMISRTDTTSAIIKWKKPTLFVCGKEDALTPPQKMNELAKISQNGKLKIIKDAGHMSMVENPKEFNMVVERFLREYFSHTLV